MVINSTPVANLYYWSEVGVLVISWTSKPDFKSFEAVYNKAFEFVDANRNIRLFCIDQTACGAFERAQEDWLNMEFYKKVYQLLQEDIFAAVVFSEDHFNAIVHNYQLHSDSIPNNFIHFTYFTSLADAEQWLHAIKKGQDLILS